MGPKPWWLRLFAHDAIAPLLLLLAALVLFVPGQWTVPPLDRDEPRFTQASKQMLETGNFVDIRLQDEPRYKKPIGIYWLQVLSAKATGYGAEAPLWVYRLPSLLAGLSVVLLTYWTARAFAAPPVALVAGLLVAAALIVGVEARLGKTDATLFAMTVLAQGALARLFLADSREPRWGLALVFWTALAGGVLIKGPVILMVVGLTVAALMLLTRRLAWFRAAAPLFGLPWMLLLILPWFVAIWIATDGSFFQEAVGRDLLGKVAEGQESHGAPPLTHLAAMLAVFWPLPAFLLLAAPRIWASRHSKLVLFAAAWFVPSWIVFELVATKLPHYTMPLLPALAIAAAAALVDGAGETAGRGLRYAAAGLLLLLPVAILGAVIIAPITLGVWPSPPGVVLCGFALVLAGWAASCLLKGAALQALPRAIAAMMVMTGGVWGFSGPALETIWVSPRLAAAIDQTATCPTPEVASSGFSEPSFVFLQGTETRLVPGEAAATFLKESPSVPDACRIAVVEKRQEEAFLAAAATLGLVPDLRGRVEGVNINGGRKLDLGLYVAGSAAQ
ncbi:glycosyltransferase family 39 protein [Microvirga tunisiensis]|uniref:Glycosyltransferase family 39 protein n=2 Tax=Pannonibacter tanglangensis TaxID=2750084 RepID=A0ABW9ZEE9_9HYPH|nr:glycosyltransferase family 39 protein [Pannonibacter sp. XCT-34]